MEFRLVYQGPLQTDPKVRVQQKQQIRRYLHPQLKELFSRPPLADQLSIFADPDVSDAATRRSIGGFTFTALITEKLRVFAELSTVILRPQQPGHIITSDGDIDNQIKVVFDALRMPTGGDELPPGDTPGTYELPYFFCLLDDDRLIRDARIVADRLLAPKTPDDVLVLIHVTVRASQRISANHFAS